MSSHAPRAPRDVAFLVFPDFQIQDLTGPLAAFEVAGRLLGGASYPVSYTHLTLPTNREV